MTWTRQNLRPARLSSDIGIRNRCATDCHEPVTFSLWLNATFCACGRITRPGDVARWATDHEICERAAGRRDHHLVCPIHHDQKERAHA